jgi:hypothetical protein
MSVSFYKTNDAISWKAVIFILAAVRIWKQRVISTHKKDQYYRHIRTGSICFVRPSDMFHPWHYWMHFDKLWYWGVYSRSSWTNLIVVDTDGIQPLPYLKMKSKFIGFLKKRQLRR